MRFVAVLAVLPLAAMAQTPAEMDLLPRLIDTGCFDLVQEINGCEQVTLLVSETHADMADVLIYPDRRTNEAGGPMLILRGAVFNGAMWGMAPALEAVPGGVRLSAEQSGIGRYPWFESIDIAHDGAEFIVTGYSYSTYDRALPRVFQCTVNLLTGAYRHEAEIGDAEAVAADPVTMAETGLVAPQHLRLLDWAGTGTAMPPCDAARAAAFGWD